MGMRQEDEWAYKLQSDLERAFRDLGCEKRNGFYVSSDLTSRFSVHAGARSHSTIHEPVVVSETRLANLQWVKDYEVGAHDFVENQPASSPALKIA
jgi:hypothetical protein